VSALRTAAALQKWVSANCNGERARAACMRGCLLLGGCMRVEGKSTERFFFFFFFFFWSVWDNETLSAEAFEAHPLGCWVLASWCRSILSRRKCRYAHIPNQCGTLALQLNLSYLMSIIYGPYCSISFKSTPGVTRGPKNQFDISTAAKTWRDASKIFDIETKILAF
jgi:hypothetical protein